MDNKDLRLFNELLSLLWSEPWNDQRPEAKQIWQDIGAACQPFEDRDKLRAALPSLHRRECDFSERHRFLYLRPSLKKTVLVPVVSIKYDFTKEPFELRFRVALFCRDGNETRAVAFRFDAPEGGGDGAHDFYHAQFIRSFRAGMGDIPFVPPWLPDTQPSFVLYAKSPVTFLAAFLVSLYGFKQIDEIFPAASHSLIHELKRFRQMIEKGQ